MKVFIYSIFDVKSGCYDRPFPSRSDAEAARSFGDICMDEDHPIGKHPDDFTLFRVAIWDDNLGEMEGYPPEKIVNGAEAIAANNVVPLKQDAN